jgi:vacuolar-type H+-ATPase subunit B/Vma2
MTDKDRSKWRISRLASDKAMATRTLSALVSRDGIVRSSLSQIATNASGKDFRPDDVDLLAELLGAVASNANVLHETDKLVSLLMETTPKSTKRRVLLFSDNRNTRLVERGGKGRFNRWLRINGAFAPLKS